MNLSTPGLPVHHQLQNNFVNYAFSRIQAEIDNEKERKDLQR